MTRYFIAKLGYGGAKDIVRDTEIEASSVEDAHAMIKAENAKIPASSDDEYYAFMRHGSQLTPLE